MTQVTVLGGGLAGLACAVALADHGLAVTVVERSNRLGGRASSWREPVTGDVVDIGPHVFHSEYHNMLALLERLGTRDLICWQPGKVLSLASKPKRTNLRLNYDFYDLSQIRQGWRGRPTVIASNIIYSHRAHHLDDAEIVRRTVAELAEIAPRAARARLLHADVHRVPMAIPCPTVGFEGMRLLARCPIPGLTLAGDWTRTLMPCTMEGAAKSGYIAAEEVLRERGVRARLAIETRMYDDLAGLVRTTVPGRSIP